MRDGDREYLHNLKDEIKREVIYKKVHKHSVAEGCSHWAPVRGCLCSKCEDVVRREIEELMKDMCFKKEYETDFSKKTVYPEGNCSYDLIACVCPTSGLGIRSRIDLEDALDDEQKSRYCRNCVKIRKRFSFVLKEMGENECD